MPREPTKLRRRTRSPMNDDEVRSFIKHEITKIRSSSQKARHTPLLRKLRDQGKACEQSRFRRLFAAVKDEINA